MKSLSISWSAVIVASSLAAVACGSSSSGASDDGSAESAQAKLEFWNALSTANIDAIAPARAHLLATFASDPDEETARLIGMSYLASIGERTNATNPPSFQEIPTYVGNAGKYLEQATQLPSDPDRKLWNSAFYAGTVYTSADPSKPADPAKQAEGRAMYQAVADKFPAFGLFNRAAQLGRASRGSPDFATALESFFLAYETCTGTKMDRAHPDVTLALNGGIGATDLNRPCGNLPHVPHNIQGELFAFADVLVKNGQVDAAKPVYAAIKKSDGYASWAFRDLVNQRLASDLTQRAALYTEADSTKWPAVGASFCTGCHQR